MRAFVDIRYQSELADAYDGVVVRFDSGIVYAFNSGDVLKDWNDEFLEFINTTDGIDDIVFSSSVKAYLESKFLVINTSTLSLSPSPVFSNPAVVNHIFRASSDLIFAMLTGYLTHGKIETAKTDEDAILFIEQRLTDNLQTLSDIVPSGDIKYLCNTLDKSIALCVMHESYEIAHTLLTLKNLVSERGSSIVDS